MALVAIAKCLFCDKHYYGESAYLSPIVADCDCAQQVLAEVARTETMQNLNKDRQVQEVGEVDANS